MVLWRVGLCLITRAKHRIPRRHLGIPYDGSRRRVVDLVEGIEQRQRERQLSNVSSHFLWCAVCAEPTGSPPRRGPLAAGFPGLRVGVWRTRRRFDGGQRVPRRFLDVPTVPLLANRTSSESKGRK